ncbi:MAG: EfeM/EfeO family lipoprotein [Planctomycetota bacterium]
MNSISRRSMLAAGAGAIGAGAFASAAVGERSSTRASFVRPASDDSPELAAAVDQGIAYFRRRCEDQLPLVLELERAIRSGDLTAAKHAYVESRPPYEEIETLAANFEETDRDIDARPYAFEEGETSAEFKGFHRIEVLLYADGDTEAALPYATELVGSIRTLGRQLGERERFSAAGQFGGMLMLATEVAAKKVSSEEETWSDQSLLIFRSNWIGVYSQYRPFTPLVQASSSSRAEAVESAYNDARELIEPHFRSGSAAGTPYSTIGVTERRAITNASMRLRDAIAAAATELGIEA